MGGATKKILLIIRDDVRTDDLADRLQSLGFCVEREHEYRSPSGAQIVLFCVGERLEDIRKAANLRSNTGSWIAIAALSNSTRPASAFLDAGCDLVLPTDITDEHLKSQLEAITRLGEQRIGLNRDQQDYLQVFEAIPHAILIMSPDFTILSANKESERLTGLTREEIRGRKCHEIFHGSSMPAPGCPLESMLKTGVTKPADMLMEALGKSHIVSITPILDKNGKVERIIHVSTDVTDRIRAEQELARREKEYRLLADTTDDIIFVHSIDGNVTYLNKAGCEFFGIETDQVKGTTISDYISPEHHELLVNNSQKMLAGSSEKNLLDIEVIDRLGQYVSMEAKTSPIVQQGEIKAILLTARDNRERRKIQIQLLQAQKMEAVGRLAAGVAHDFNNLLTAILGNCDLLQVDLKAGRDPDDGLAEIRIASEKACALTQRMLAFSRQTPSITRVIDLNTAMINMEKMLRRVIGEDIELIVQVSQKPMTVKAAPVRFEQVILNLAVNARDAMPDGGRLSFRLRTVTLDEQSTLSNPGIKPGTFHELSVSDTGSGMSEETRKKVFEPFFTTKEEGRGTGLGLATVKDILVEAGGQVLVYSEPGQGSTFRLFWPPSDKSVDKASERRSTASRGEGEIILLLEDEEIVRSMVKTALVRWGYEVIEATDARQALKKASGLKTIHLLLADVVLPGGMNGIEVAERLRTLHAGLKTVFMSGYSGDIIFRSDTGSDINLLQKPFNLNELLSIVRNTLNS